MFLILYHITNCVNKYQFGQMTLSFRFSPVYFKYIYSKLLKLIKEAHIAMSYFVHHTESEYMFNIIGASIFYSFVKNVHCLRAYKTHFFVPVCFVMPCIRFEFCNKLVFTLVRVKISIISNPKCCCLYVCLLLPNSGYDIRNTH